jgi:hypothetical protein
MWRGLGWGLFNNQPVFDASVIGDDGAGCGEESVALRSRIGPTVWEIWIWRWSIDLKTNRSNWKTSDGTNNKQAGRRWWEWEVLRVLCSVVVVAVTEGKHGVFAISYLSLYACGKMLVVDSCRHVTCAVTACIVSGQIGMSRHVRGQMSGLRTCPGQMTPSWPTPPSGSITTLAHSTTNNEARKSHPIGRYADISRNTDRFDIAMPLFGGMRRVGRVARWIPISGLISLWGSVFGLGEFRSDFGDDFFFDFT